MAVDKTVVSVIFCWISVAFLVGAFASPYWVVSFDKADSRFVKAGLWEFCFNDYTFWKDYNGNRFKGCWYIFSDQYRPIWEWLSPHWFIACQVMVSVCLLFTVVAACICSLVALRVFPTYLNEIILFGIAITMFFIVLLGFIQEVLFGVMKEDRQWVPRPDQNYLSFSYGFMVIHSIFALISGLVLLKAGFDVRNELKEDYPGRGRY